MKIRLSDERRATLLGHIQTFFRDELEQDIGGLKARFVLDLFLERLAPSVYNQAIGDAQSRMQEKILDRDALSNIEWLAVTGHGDPFASRLYRNLLREIDAKYYPYLRIQLITNAVLFTPQNL